MSDKDSIDPTAPHRPSSDLGIGVSGKAPGISRRLIIGRKRGNLDEVGRRRKPLSPGNVQHRNLDEPRPGADNPDTVGRFPGKVDDSPGDKGPAIVDRDIDRPTVGQIRDANLRTQG